MSLLAALRIRIRACGCAQTFAWIVLGSALSGCGFQLRGSMDVQLPPAMERTLVRGVSPQSELAAAVEDGLVQVGAGLADGPADASAVLNLDEDFTRRVASVGSDGRVNEYELHYRLRFSMDDAAGEDIVAEQDIDLYRSYFFDPDQVLAKSNEQALMRDEMMRGAVAQMLRRLEKSAARDPNPDVSADRP